MNTGLLFAFELYKANHNDLLRQAEEARLGKCLSKSSQGRTRRRSTGSGRGKCAEQLDGEAA
jgi:hypothetical protein